MKINKCKTKTLISSAAARGAVVNSLEETVDGRHSWSEHISSTAPKLGSEYLLDEK